MIRLEKFAVDSLEYMLVQCSVKHYSVIVVGNLMMTFVVAVCRPVIYLPYGSIYPGQEFQFPIKTIHAAYICVFYLLLYLLKWLA